MEIWNPSRASELKRAIAAAFAERGWPAPVFTPSGVCVGGEVIGLDKFSKDFELAIALCTFHLDLAGVETPPVLAQAPLPQVVGAPWHEYTAGGRGKYPQHISERL